MTPYEISILLHYHSSVVDDPQIKNPPPIWRGAIDSFIRAGLMETTKELSNRRCYLLTEKGHFYVTEGLCNVPLPQQSLVIPWPPS